MASTAETLQRTASTCFEAGRKFIRREELKIPRTTLAIFNGINVIFPDEIKKGGLGGNLEKLSDLAPILIALNEASDLGESAVIRASACCDPGKGTDLLQFSNKLFLHLDKEVGGFVGKYGENSWEAHVVDNLRQDFLLLSQGRKKFSPAEFREFVELDSGIYIAACVGLTIPEVVRESGIDIGHKCLTLDEVRGKYKIFTTNRNGEFPFAAFKSNFGRARNGLIALQAAEMVLKVNDDVRGAQLDPKLGIISLDGYVRHIADRKEEQVELIKKLRGEYLDEAVRAGIPRISVIGAEKLGYYTSILKAKLTSRGISSNNIDEIINSSTTTLRHQLEALGVINRLFVAEES